MNLWETARGLVPVRRTVRIGVTGLARAGKTSFLTSVAANLLAAGAGLPALPRLTDRLAGRTLRVSLAPAGAEALPRFDVAAKLAALAADPPRFPTATGAVSVLALNLDIGWPGIAAALPPRLLRLEFLDYPGEWLLDLPLLAQDFATWSDAVLRRLEAGPAAEPARAFLGFVRGLPDGAGSDETLARAGHDLYVALLRHLREETGLALLQPGRFLMPAPGEQPPPWNDFFPLPGRSGLAGLLARRFAKYQEQVRADLVSPSFGAVDRLLVLADVLTALHAGPAAFADAAAALAAVAEALRWRSVPDWLDAFVPTWLLPGRISRVAYAATKSDHVADRQRGNLASLVATLTRSPAPAAAFAIASVRCTEDMVWTLEGRPVSAVRGRILGNDRLARSYPGEVPDRAPDAAFWAHPFFALPAFEPMRLPLEGRGGVPHINLDALLAYLLEDLL